MKTVFKRTSNCFFSLSVSAVFFVLLSSCLILPADAKENRFKILEDGTVKDLQTRLIWAASDNGTDISWLGAMAYCRNYRMGGHTDWRMATVSELTSLYGNHQQAKDKDQNQYLSINVVTDTIYISAPFVWTTRKLLSHKAMAFGFNYGTSRRLKRGTGGNRRALPVRSVPKQ